MLDFDSFDDADDRPFRHQVRDFVAQHLPAATRRRVAHNLELQKSDYVGWQRILFDHGWFPGPWPREFGGAGWSVRQYSIFLQENGLGGAPMIMPYGVSMIGPILYTFGNSEQHQRFLPGIRDSSTWWCQGYSEPNAGSDLASLATRADIDGDHYVVNGTKMWTTQAHWADWMHCLVRTSSSGKPQQGITYLLIDMQTPGIRIEPIATMDGIHHTNQIFFDGVRVPMANRIGGEGDGWKMARFLLEHERGAIADTGTKMFFFNQLEQQLIRLLATDLPAALRASLTHQFDELRRRLLGLCALERLAIERWESGSAAGHEGSMLKLRSTELYQAMGEFGLVLHGAQANAFDQAALHGAGFDPARPSHATIGALHHYLYGRAWTIFGGTSEIQRNIMARVLL